ncbi:ABC transporter permease [Planosporangium sp. 12N6]|uniref:ABC transporter permease n=1 Tax=Planosporangium spinosum TaxID=3402278 RepID=UPI003CE9F93B
MLAYVVRRFLISIPILIGSTILVFLMAKVSGDPLETMKLRNPPPPRQTILNEEHRLGLDQPLHIQYLNWLKNLLLHGDFGPSVHATTDIGHELGDRLLVTLRLVLISVLLALIFAVITGVVSAVKQYSVTDYTFTFMGFLFLAMPTFWFAILLKSAAISYNQATGTQTFFTIGDKSVFIADDSTWGHVKDIAGHMVLPTIVLGLVGYAAWSRFQRASMLEVLNSDYVRLARAKGLSPRRVLVRHALRTALIPLTTVTALDIAALLGGAIITERVFQWHGLGEFFLDSVADHDANAMMGWLLISAVIVILFNLVADLLYGVLDPRIRYE